MNIPYLSGDVIDALMRPEDWLAAARGAMIASARNDRTSAPRALLSVADGAALLAMMPGWLVDKPFYGLKVVSVSDLPRASDAEPHQGVVLVFDSRTGLPAALLDATRITLRRTAWCSALATDILAPPDARVLAILGTGAQALAHVAALRAVRPFSRVLIWGRDAQRAAKVAAAIDGQAVNTAEDAVRVADVICTVTAARSALFDVSALKPTAHINAVGASVPGFRELTDALVAAVPMWVDHPASVAAQADDVRGAFGDNCASRLWPLGGAIAGPRGDGRGQTLYRAVGVVAQDLWAAAIAVDRASAAGGVTTIDMG